MLRAIAPAKVNLFLHVLGRRANGYHDLQSLVAFTEFGDRIDLELGPGESYGGTTFGHFAGALDGDAKHSIDEALAILNQLHPLKARETQYKLDKRIPVAAGLGGGSSDAAAALNALNELWSLNLSAERLAEIGLEIGADVPVCLRGRATLVEGIGEKLNDAPVLPERFPIVLAHTGKALPTANVFKEMARADWSETPAAMPARFETRPELVAFLKSARNDLEAPARRLQPEIGALIEEISHQPGCMMARMSGSGAACFGLFGSEIEAFAAGERLKRLGWWAVATRLKS